MTTYLITGATGTLGRLAAHALADLDPTADLHVLARPGTTLSPALVPPAAVRRGDYDDPSSLVAALVGIQRLLLVSSPVLEPTTRARQHRAVIQAAEEAGVEHVVYTSALGAEHDPGHLDTERALTERRTPWTVLRNGLYTEPFLSRAREEAVSTGTVRSATGGRAVCTASVHDLADAAARVLHDPRAMTTLELNGPGWTYDELAAALSAELGRTVTHEPVAPDALGPMGPVHALFAAGLLAQGPATLTALLDRGPRSMADVLRDRSGAE